MALNKIFSVYVIAGAAVIAGLLSFVGKYQHLFSLFLLSDWRDFDCSVWGYSL
ncbi:hypothetical protein [Streptococcus equi]|uniref:hypothetical protein n=1 Tax=Streptococcus equi TaxID=1336 RepID=UPI0022AB7558|nr:hypothetical protein [Streptococcus equi]